MNALDKLDSCGDGWDLRTVRTWDVLPTLPHCCSQSFAMAAFAWCDGLHQVLVDPKAEKGEVCVDSQGCARPLQEDANEPCEHVASNIA